MFSALKKASGVSNETELEYINLTNMSKQQLLDFLALEISKSFNDIIAFKGGYTLTKMLENPRMTQDIDISIGVQADYIRIKELLNTIGTKLVDEGIAHSYTIKEEISEVSSGGIKIYNEDGSILIGVDVGLHQIVKGVVELDFGFDTVTVFSPERMIADKISATLSRKRFRRSKDIYDIHCILTKYEIDFNLTKELLDMRMQDRLYDWNNFPFNEIVLVELEKAYKKLSVINFFTGNSMAKPEFEEVYSLFYKLVYPLKNGKQHTKWSCEYLDWV